MAHLEHVRKIKLFSNIKNKAKNQIKEGQGLNSNRKSERINI